jgi:hypothetical protein
MIMTKSRVLLVAVAVLALFQIFFWRERIRTCALHLGIGTSEIIDVPETETSDLGRTDFDEEVMQ